MIRQSIESLAQFSDVILFIFAPRSEHIDISKYGYLRCKEIHVIHLPNTLRVLTNIAFRSRKNSLQQSLYHDPKSIRLIQEKLRHYHLDTAIFDMARTAIYAEGVKANRIVIDLDDLLSDRYSAMLGRPDSNANVFGSYSHRIHPLIAKTSNRIYKHLLHFEMKKMALIESGAAKLADAVLLTSAIEARKLRAKAKRENIFSNPPTIAHANRPWSPPVRKPGERRKILFLGNLRTKHNADSLRNIVESIFPLIRNRIDVDLIVAGAYDKEDDGIADIYRYPDVKFLGFVENLDSIASDIDCALLPIAYGTGVKTKILECMAYGLPIVTNLKGAEGIDAQLNSAIAVHETPEDMAAAVICLLSSSDTARMMGFKAWQYIQDSHSPETTTGILLQVALGAPKI